MTGSQARPTFTKSAFIFRSGFGYANSDRGVLLTDVDVEKFCRSSYKFAVAIQDHVVGTLHLQRKQNWLDLRYWHEGYSNLWVSCTRVCNKDQNRINWSLSLLRVDLGHLEQEKSRDQRYWLIGAAAILPLKPAAYFKWSKADKRAIKCDQTFWSQLHTF